MIIGIFIGDGFAMQSNVKIKHFNSGKTRIITASSTDKSYQLKYNSKTFDKEFLTKLCTRNFRNRELQYLMYKLDIDLREAGK
jgi:hypothetical protein